MTRMANTTTMPVMMVRWLSDEGQCESGGQKRAATAGAEDERAGTRVHADQAERGKHHVLH